MAVEAEDVSIRTTIRTAVDADKIIVEAAGNGAKSLDGPEYAFYRSFGDTGAIIVGAGCWGVGHLPMAFTTYGSRVDLQAWGQEVFTTGKGFLSHVQDTGDTIWVNGQSDFGQCYRRQFSGTSSATPMVAASVALVQSFAEAEFGCRLKPRQMRKLLIDTGIPQAYGVHIGPIPNVGEAVESVVYRWGADCNHNAIADLCDTWTGASGDCNFNLVPDDCEPQPDCNNNGFPDICDLGIYRNSKDCNRNGIPDECDIATGSSVDICANGIPDECEPDCNENGVPDYCDIQAETSIDACGNGIPDECERDCNRNGTPDQYECPISPAALVPPTHESGGFFAKNRFISVVPQNSGVRTALRIFISPDFVGWVGSPGFITEFASAVTPSTAPPGYGTIRAAPVVCAPVYRNWGEEGTVHVFGNVIFPGKTFYVSDVCEACGIEGVSSYLTVSTTSLWGDITGGWNPATSAWDPPDGVSDMIDVSAVVDRFMNSTNAPSKTLVDLGSGLLDHIVDFADISYAVDAAVGHPYPFEPGENCPVPCVVGTGTQGPGNPPCLLAGSAD